jgi:hypothetical protein
VVKVTFAASPNLSGVKENSMAIRNLMVAGLAAVVCVSSVYAQDEDKDKKKGGMYFGVKGGLYLPTDGEIRDIFGSTIFVFGISFDDFTKQADKWRLTADFDFITGSKDGNKFFAAPITASLGRVFGKPEDTTRPYVRFGVGGAYFDYSITRPSTGERFSTKRFGFSADAEVGVFLGERVRLSAKYVLLSEVDDFNLSGLQFTATFNLFKF